MMHVSHFGQRIFHKNLNSRFYPISDACHQVQSQKNVDAEISSKVQKC